MIQLIVTASIFSFISGFFGVNWSAVDEKIELEFPRVEFVSTAVLIQQYQDLDSGFPLIIDVREQDEFRVSHLQNALNLETADSVARLYEDKDTPIIVYCSVGYRSARVAEGLSQLGYTNVLNLHHSIFEWANKGYPMVNNDGETKKAHPFNRAWGALLDEPLRSYSIP
ncbi:MAG: sulfurtransferase [SAR86 cluster bacterium]|uniref:Sulfurtransferase n=1 Tax=SAR86 cluster bacterium TaxID=2030880 RepID=A0A2A5AWJ8_9GAMM|nr:MAG: sulfurtransferase [SAR86 cluster bacterium]